MLKLQWDTVTDKFEHNFVIGNVESIWRLFFLFKNLKTGIPEPINVKMFDLSGIEVNTKEGISEAYALSERTKR